MWESLALVVQAVALAALAWHVLRRRQPPPPPPPTEWLKAITHSACVVHTKDGNTYQGLLAAVFNDGVLLKSATHIDAQVQLAGDVFVPRAMIAMVQREE